MRPSSWICGGCAAIAVAGIVAVFPPGPAGTADAACCYFSAQEKDITQPGQKAFITWDPESKVESFTVQPKFEGNAEDFGMVIPTPAQPKLDEMPRDFFKDLAIYTILLPVAQAVTFQEVGMIGAAFSADEEGSPAPSPVRVLEAGVVGSLDYKILSADKASALFEWLKDNRYTYSGDEETLQHYISKKWVFTVMKIDPRQMRKNSDGTYQGEVTPTRFTFSSDRCVYPLRITRISVPESTDALFYVQAPEQMDLEGNLSWMPSHRIMWLTYMLGCSISEAEQAELDGWSAWLQERQSEDELFQTTKLEWAKRLGPRDLAVLDDPVRLWGQGGGAPLGAGDRVISHEQFLKDARTVLEALMPGEPDAVKERLKEFADDYQALKGDIVRIDRPQESPVGSRYVFYPRRDAPEEELKGLTRLKGHLQSGRWLTKFRRIVRKGEMADDLVLVPVQAGKEQEYTRLTPESPP